MISFTFDDGDASNLSVGEPILRRYGMVATVGAICDQAFWRSAPGLLRADDLRYLAGTGWEIASHSIFHRRLPLLPPSYDDELASWHYHKGTGAWVAECRWEDVGTVAYEGKFLKRARSVADFNSMSDGFLIRPDKATIHVKSTEQEFAADRLRLGSAEREIAGSREIFRQNGFDPTVFVVPFSNWSPSLQEIGTKYYSVIAGGGTQYNTRETVSRKRLSRFGVGADVSVQDVITRLEDHLSHGSWAIIMLHDLVSEMRGKWKWTTSQFESVVEWVSESGVPVCTLSEGVERLRA